MTFIEYRTRNTLPLREIKRSDTEKRTIARVEWNIHLDPLIDKRELAVRDHVNILQRQINIVWEWAWFGSLL